MHFTQTALAAAALAGALHLGVNAVIPEPPPPPPLVVNSLTYADGVVTQDRTINADSKLWMIWEAYVVSELTGQPVPGCSGSGFWDYSPGHLVARVPVREWVGSPDCKLVEGAGYQLVARYKAGAWSTDARSEVFVK